MLIRKEEKKVEYIELIYDLVFVYMVGRNNALLSNFENGFVHPAAFFAYILCTFAVIQIWNFTTYYINMFGRNGVRDHISLFINMYLMYFIGQSTRSDWEAFQTQYHIAWGLILVNIGMQYVIELKNHKDDRIASGLIRQRIITLFVEAGIVFAAAFTDTTAGIVLSVAAVLAGIVLSVFGNKKEIASYVDFSHLTERAMLYVVFTFGEMIIALAVYFIGDGGFSWNTIYFSLMAFLIVAGLFLSYERFYDHLLDREKKDNGLRYILIHVFLIFVMNNITVALEFMREEEILVFPKILMIVLSIIGFYALLFGMAPYTKKKHRFDRKFILKMLLASAAFVILMILLRENMYANILVTAIYVFTVYGITKGRFFCYKFKHK